MRLTSVIIPSRKTENLRPCIQALLEHDAAAPIRVIVVDDGLTERPPNQVMELDIQTIDGVKSFVFSRNCNLGIRAAGDEDVILLNDDCLLTNDGGFARLIECGQRNPEYGVISAAVSNTGNPNQRPRGVGLREEKRMVCFACAYIPRRTLQKVGLLDERFTAYGFDDDDYCLRVRKAGLKLGVFDGCIMDHSTLESTFRGRAAGNLEAGCQIFMQKWGHDAWGRKPIGAMR